jgi:hypothetical protein
MHPVTPSTLTLSKYITLGERKRRARGGEMRERGEEETKGEWTRQRMEYGMKVEDKDRERRKSTGEEREYVPGAVLQAFLPASSGEGCVIFG